MIGSRDLNEILHRLQADDPIARGLAGSELGDLVSADALNGRQYETVMRTLIPLALAESDPQTRESMFHTLSEAGERTAVESVDWEPLAVALNDLPAECLEYSLYILGSSRNRNYLPHLQRFLTHSDPTIRAAAADALRELQSAKASSTAKAK